MVEQEKVSEAHQPQESRTAIRTPLFGRWAVGLLGVLGILMLVGVLLSWKTRDAMANLPFLQHGGTAGALVARQQSIVDETPWKTAQALAALAVTQEEMTYARQAERLADHEVDQAFATALRKANLRQRTLTGDALARQQKVAELESLVSTDQAAVKQLADKGGDDEDVAQAQLGLDQDELSDAREDLARASGDERGEIQQELTAREAEMKKFDAAGGTGEVAVVSVQRYRTLAGLIGAWRKQRSRQELLQQAREAAQTEARRLDTEHSELETKWAHHDAPQKAAPQAGAPQAGAPQAGAPQTSAAQTASAQQAPASGAAADRVAGLKRMALERQLMSIYYDRIATEEQLAEVYGKWAAQISLQHRIVEHLLTLQVMLVVGIVILAILLSAVVKRLSDRESLDKRRARTLGWIARLAVQVVALLALLLVIFGPPNQLSTVIGLVTAGLTVALQDFILAFVGWFILMGRSGIGVGDVVEINAVSGEVVDIGLFRTTLLETGNWTDKGHPTGRRVAFNNKYAISGQFFNFSTAGQWMWDELTVPLTAGEDSGDAIERVQKTVNKETAEDTQQAEAEWKHVSQRHGLSQFSAEPAVNMRPSATGMELVVRYVTRATGRFERKNTLYGCVLQALHAPSPEAQATA